MNKKILATILLLVATLAFAADKYVNSSGNLILDAGSGSYVKVLKEMRVTSIKNIDGTSGAPGQVPIGVMVAAMPSFHANAWQPPASGAIKDGFMRADGATISAQNVTDGSVFPAGTVLPNMSNSFLRGATTSSATATGSDTRDISHNHTMAHTHDTTVSHTHTMAHTHDTSIAHTHGYGFAHTHGTDSQLSTLSLAHQHNYKHGHQILYGDWGIAAVGLSSATNSTTSFDTWSVTPGGSATQTFVFLGADSGQIGGSGSTRPNVRVPTTATTAVYSSGVVSGVSGDGASALTDPQLGSNNLAHSHSTTSQAGTTGTTTSQTGTTFTSGAASNATTSAPSTSTFTSGAASNATTTSGGSASLDIKPAYLNTVWVIRVM